MSDRTWRWSGLLGATTLLLCWVVDSYLWTPSADAGYGNRALGPDEAGDIDVSVMDDFIFGEPQPIN